MNKELAELMMAGHGTKGNTEQLEEVLRRLIPLLQDSKRISDLEDGLDSLGDPKDKELIEAVTSLSLALAAEAARRAARMNPTLAAEIEAEFGTALEFGEQVMMSPHHHGFTYCVMRIALALMDETKGQAGAEDQLDLPGPAQTPAKSD